MHAGFRMTAIFWTCQTYQDVIEDDDPRKERVCLLTQYLVRHLSSVFTEGSSVRIHPQRIYSTRCQDSVNVRIVCVCVSSFYIRPTVVQTGPFWYLSIYVKYVSQYVCSFPPTGTHLCAPSAVPDERRDYST